MAVCSWVAGSPGCGMIALVLYGISTTVLTYKINKIIGLVGLEFLFRSRGVIQEENVWKMRTFCSFSRCIAAGTQTPIFYG